jgi:hypothetical protein
VSFKYLPSGRNADLLDEGNVLIVVAADTGDEFYWLDDDGDNLATPSANVIDVAGRAYRAILDYGIVYPQDHVAGQPVSGYRLGGQDFLDNTIGSIVSTLITRAQERGALTGLEYDFDSDVDSNGTPWPSSITISYTGGTTITKVLDQLLSMGLVEERMTGRTLQLFVPGTLTADRPTVILRRGQGVITSPRKRTRASIRSVVLALGDNNSAVEIVNAAAVTRYGRREAYSGIGGVADFNVLTAIATSQSTDLSDASENLTLEYVPTPQIPVAGIAYRCGDTIRYDQRRLADGTLEHLQVNSIAWAVDNQGGRVVSVEILDEWITSAEKRQLAVDALTNNSQTPWAVPHDRPGADTVPPSAPLNVALTTSVAFTTPHTAGELRESSASAIVDWDPVDRNNDGSVYDDQGPYYVSLLYPTTGGGQWSAEQSAAAPPITISGLPWSTGVQARVRAQDKAGNSSDWAFSNVATTVAAYSSPAKAAAPTLYSVYGQIHATWNGKDSTGATPVSPVVGAEVHTSLVSGFTPDDSTRVEFMPGGPLTLVLRPRAYTQPTYVRLVLVDYLGQRGTPSDQASITPAQVVAADLTDGLIGTAKLADAAVITAKIADASVNDAQIASVSAGAITTGNLTANVVNAGFLRTAQSGARVQASSAGIQAYNAAGQPTTAFNTDGTAVLTGTFGAVDVSGPLWFRTAAGQPFFLMDPSQSAFSSVPTIYFGSNSAYEYASGLLANQVGGDGYTVTLQAPQVYAPPSSRDDWLTQAIVMHNYDDAHSTNIEGGAVRFNLHNYIYPAGPGITHIRFRDSMVRTSDSSSLTENAPGVMFFASVADFGYHQTALRGYQNCLDAVQEDDGTGITAWAAVRYLSPAPQSNERVKTDITALPFRAADVIRAHPAKQWRYRPDAADPRRLHLGPMSDDLPEQLVERHGDDVFLDAGSMLGLLWAVFAEIDETLTAQAA